RVGVLREVAVRDYLLDSVRRKTAQANGQVIELVVPELVRVHALLVRVPHAVAVGVEEHEDLGGRDVLAGIKDAIDHGTVEDRAADAARGREGAARRARAAMHGPFLEARIRRAIE